MLPPFPAKGNVHIEILRAHVELLHNGGFELGSLGWIAGDGAGWYDEATGPNPDGSAHRAVVYPMPGLPDYPGIYSDDNGNFTPVHAGAKYRLSGWQMHVGTQQPRAARIEFHDASLAVVGIFEAYHGDANDGVWREFSFEAIAPVSAVWARVRLFIYGTDVAEGVYACWDAVSWVGPPREGLWADVTPQSMVAKLGWGADDPQGILTVPASGHWSVTTYDPDRKLDPSNGASPNAASLKPGRPMRVLYGTEIVRLGLLDEIEYDLRAKTGSMRGTDIVPLIVNAKMAAPYTGAPTTLRARARWLIDKAGLKLLVPVEGDDINGADIWDYSGDMAPPDGGEWAGTGLGNGAQTAIIQGESPDNDGFFLRFTGSGQSSPVFGGPWGDVVPGASYRLSFWARARNQTTQTMRMEFRQVREDWSEVSAPRPFVDIFANVAGWQWVVLDFTTEADAARGHSNALILASPTGDVGWDIDHIECYPHKSVVDPAVGPLPENDASCWALIGASAYDALYATWIDRRGVLRFRSFGEPVDVGFQVGGDGGIPISTLRTFASIQNVYTVVRAFDQDAPTVPVVKQNDDAIGIFGVIPLTREKPVPDAEFWTTNVLNDRSGAALQYQTGTLYPQTHDALMQIIALEMLDSVHIVADDIVPTLDFMARLLGVNITADTDTGWTAEIGSYIPAKEWEDAEVPPIEPPIDPPPVTHQETRYYNATKDTRAARDSGGTALGSGTEGELPVGAWQGWRNRAFIDFADIPWTGVVSVDKAVLELDTSSQVNIGFGSDPKVIVSRVTQSWSEGSSSSPSGSNATKYPGPSTTSSNQVTKTITRSENAAVSIDITNIVRDMKTVGAQHGVRIISAGEDSTKYTTEFWSRENSTSGKRPRLVVTVTVEGPAAEEM